MKIRLTLLGLLCLFFGKEGQAQAQIPQEGFILITAGNPPPVMVPRVTRTQPVQQSFQGLPPGSFVYSSNGQPNMVMTGNGPVPIRTAQDIPAHWIKVADFDLPPSPMNVQMMPQGVPMGVPMGVPVGVPLGVPVAPMYVSPSPVVMEATSVRGPLRSVTRTRTTVAPGYYAAPYVPQAAVSPIRTPMPMLPVNPSGRYSQSVSGWGPPDGTQFGSNGDCPTGNCPNGKCAR